MSLYDHDAAVRKKQKARQLHTQMLLETFLDKCIEVREKRKVMIEAKKVQKEIVDEDPAFKEVFYKKYRDNIASMVFNLNGNTNDSELLETLNASIEELLGQKAKLSTAGGTSDGRFIAPLGTKVVEFGPRSNLIHKVNEAVELASIDKLHQIYVKTLEKIFC